VFPPSPEKGGPQKGNNPFKGVPNPKKGNHPALQRLGAKNKVKIPQ